MPQEEPAFLQDIGHFQITCGLQRLFQAALAKHFQLNGQVRKQHYDRNTDELDNNTTTPGITLMKGK